MLGVTRFLAKIAQVSKLALQLSQFTNTTGNVADVLIEQFIDRTAVLRRYVLEAQQDSNFVKRHVQTAAIANEGKPLGVGVTINTEVTFCASGFR